MTYPNGYPDSAEIARARRFVGWAYEGGFDTAEEIYQHRYGELPCWARESPDGGLLRAIDFLLNAVSRLEGLEK